MRISFVVAMTRGRVIGRDGDLPWRLPRDLKHFRRLTWGKPIIMGRKTHESLGRALPGRTNIVLTRGDLTLPPDVRPARSVREALHEAASTGADEAMIIGGGQVYRAFESGCSTIHLTLVEADVEGDVRFPFDPLSSPSWRAVHQERWAADAENALDATYVVLERITPPGPVRAAGESL